MWSPTHVQVTVCRVKGLLTKGKNGTNDCFVTISLGKEKFQTSVKQKALSDLEWQEECELAIPTQGNTAEIVLTALHQNFIGVDEFLGMISLPLAQFDVYERPRTKWFALKSKPGQEGKSKYRGEIEIRVAFTVKSGSLLDLSKKDKHKGSLGQISQAAHSIGGSLMNLGSKDKKGGIKKLASSMGSKLRLPGKGDKGDKDGRLSRHSSGRYSGKFSGGEPDPGVISEDDDEFRFDELSHKSSGSSLNLAGGSSQASGQGSLENLGGGELLRHNSMKRSGSSASTIPNRAIQSSSSSSSLTTTANAPAASGNGSGKSPQTKDWNQKIFGSKQSKVTTSSSASTASSDSAKMSDLREEEEMAAPVFSVIRPKESSVGAFASAAASTASAAATPSNSSRLSAGGGVPSIIIQDSFIVHELPSPTSSEAPPTVKPRSIELEKEETSPSVPPPLPSSEPPPKPRHRNKEMDPPAPTISNSGEEIAVAAATTTSAGADDGSLFLGPIRPLPVRPAPRMPDVTPLPPSSFPVTALLDGAEDDDDNFLRSLSSSDRTVQQLKQQQQQQPLRPAPPVPKPRTISPIFIENSPVPPPVATRVRPPQTNVNPFEESDLVLLQDQVVSSAFNPFEDEEEEKDDVPEPVIVSVPVVSNPFEEDEDDSSAGNPFEESDLLNKEEEEEEEEKDNEEEKKSSIDRFGLERLAMSLENLTEEELDAEDDLNEESVCRWLEKAIEEHDEGGLGAGLKLQPVSAIESAVNLNVIKLLNGDEDDPVEDAVCEKSTVDFFNDQTMEISPVLRTQALVDEKATTPTRSTRRDRLLSLFSTPTSEADAEERSVAPVGVVHLNWMEDDDEDDETAKESSHSQGFVGSEHLTTSASNSAEVVASLPMEIDADDSLFPSPDLDAARRRRLSSILPPRVQEPEYTPPTGSVETLSQPTPGVPLTPKVPDLSWDNYDIHLITTPSSGAVLPSLAEGEEETMMTSHSSLTSEASPATRKKRISLAPSLRAMSWVEPPTRGGSSSPLTEDEDEFSKSQEATMAAASAATAAAAATAASNETHRMKMAASFHQRVVVGEDKPVNNNLSRDNHHAPRESPSSEDRHRIYQGRSREGLISLLEDRDNEIADLKDYIDCLLLRVIDTCPTVLQTPLKANRNARK